MRAFREYSIQDWLRLVPLKWLVKQVRNDLGAYIFCKSASREEIFLEKLRLNASGQLDLAIVIAFENVEVVRNQIIARNKYQCFKNLLIVDNSRDDLTSSEIATLCKIESVPYIKLPKLKVRHPARSHSYALQWTYKNIVEKIKPRAFGFIDHDLFPFCDKSPFEEVENSPFYGLKRDSVIGNGSWQLWTGFCFFNYKLTKEYELNFFYDFSNGLDSGGRNFTQLYGFFSQEDQFFTNQSLATFDIDGQKMTLEVLDEAWIHLGGVGYMQNFDDRWNAFYPIYLAISSSNCKNSDLNQIAIDVEVLPVGKTYMGYKNDSWQPKGGYRREFKSK